MAGGEQIGRDADCAVFAGAVGGGGCGGGEGGVNIQFFTKSFSSINFIDLFVNISTKLTEREK